MVLKGEGTAKNWYCVSGIPGIYYIPFESHRSPFSPSTLAFWPIGGQGGLNGLKIAEPHFLKEEWGFLLIPIRRDYEMGGNDLSDFLNYFLRTP